jgi:hypothetical protein
LARDHGRQLATVGTALGWFVGPAIILVAIFVFNFAVVPSIIGGLLLTVVLVEIGYVYVSKRVGLWGLKTHFERKDPALRRRNLRTAFLLASAVVAIFAVFARMFFRE